MTTMARLEKWLIILIGLHSIGVGGMLLFTPAWAVQFAGWAGADPLFFLRQAGVFHVVLGLGYMLEHFRYRGILLLLTAKAIALVFLMVMTAIGDVPWAVPFCGIADGLMGLIAWIVHRITKRTTQDAQRITP